MNNKTPVNLDFLLFFILVLITILYVLMFYYINKTMVFI
jgi:uncharacterized protein (UPF0333 family)